MLFQSVASGHNDLLVMLAIAGALALVFSGRELAATAALAFGTLVKATAAVPLLLLLVVVVARRPRGERGRALLGHLAVAVGIGLVFSLPFQSTSRWGMIRHTSPRSPRKRMWSRSLASRV